MATRSNYQYVEALRRDYMPLPQEEDRATGRRYIPIVCAFCNHLFRANRRSFTGTGKKCDCCGARHTSDYTAVPLLSWANKHITEWVNELRNVA